LGSNENVTAITDRLVQMAMIQAFTTHMLQE